MSEEKSSVLPILAGISTPLLLSFLGVMIKEGTNLGYNSEELLFFASIIEFVIILLIIIIKQRCSLLPPNTNKKKVIFLLICQAFFKTIHNIMYYIALNLLPLGNVYGIYGIKVPLTFFMSFLVLKESLNITNFISLGTSVIGTILISQPAFLFKSAANDIQSNYIGYLLCIIGCFADALLFVILKKLNEIPTNTIVLISSAFTSIYNNNCNVYY